MIKKFVLLIVMALLVAACSTKVDTRRDHTFNYLTITISEAAASKMIETILQADPASDFQEPQADLRPGEIVVAGKVRQPDSGQLTPGTFKVRLWVVDNKLQAEITSIDFAGWAVSSEELARINAAVTTGLAQSVAPRRITILQAVTIGEDDLRFVFRTPRRSRTPRR